MTVRNAVTIEVRHSDYGEDAGGYRVLRFNGDWVGRVEGREAGELLVRYVRQLEGALEIARSKGHNVDYWMMEARVAAEKE